MPWIKIIFIILCILIIQTTLLFHISFLGIRPDLFIIFLVYVSLNSDPERAFYANWVTGLTKDFFSEGPFGLNSIIFVAAGYLILTIRNEIFRKDLVTQILVTLAISIIYNLFYVFMLSISLGSTNLLTAVWKCPMAAVYNSLIVVPVFWVFKKLYYPLRFTSLNRK